jgi:hypothetical protein
MRLNTYLTPTVSRPVVFAELLNYSALAESIKHMAKRYGLLLVPARVSTGACSLWQPAPLPGAALGGLAK